MEITKETGLELYVENNVHSFGVAGPEDKIQFSFPIKMTADRIDYIDNVCSCTTAFYNSGAIKGVLDLGKLKHKPGENAINKYIYVYFADGEAHFISDPITKQKRTNQNKSFFRLMLTGVVIAD